MSSGHFVLVTLVGCVLTSAWVGCVMAFLLILAR